MISHIPTAKQTLSVCNVCSNANGFQDNSPVKYAFHTLLSSYKANLMLGHCIMLLIFIIIAPFWERILALRIVLAMPFSKPRLPNVKAKKNLN